MVLKIRITFYSILFYSMHPYTESLTKPTFLICLSMPFEPA